jgi:hypothetical protein
LVEKDRYVQREMIIFAPYLSRRYFPVSPHHKLKRSSIIR